MEVTTPVVPDERRRQAGSRRRERSRLLLLNAADELFREKGYNATTVSAIAERAGVALQTLYLAWESKSALFRAAADAAVTASGIPLTAQAWRDVIRDELAHDLGDEPSAESYLTAVAQIFVQVAERTAVYWQMQPAAAVSEPDIAAGYARAMGQRRITIEGVAREIPERGLRPGLSSTMIADTLWALASPDVYALFVSQGGRTPAEFQRWLTATLTAALCVPDR